VSTPEPPRKRYNVGAWKIPYYQRDVAHSVIAGGDDRGYYDVIGSNTPDGDEKFPVGSATSYSVELTDGEAELFAAASNARYVEEIEEYFPHRALGWPTGCVRIPTPETLAWMRGRYVDLRRWHGRDVRVAILDQGTTKAMRDALGLTLVARTVTAVGASFGPDDVDGGHGCATASEGVPAGGLLLDAVISSGGSAFDTAMAAGIRWAVDNGAKVINLSFGGFNNGAPPSQVFQDACAYARDNGNIQITISAGNDNQPELSSPSTASRLFSNVHSSIAFNERTDRRAAFSNHHADASGCCSGENVGALTIQGRDFYTESGTSMSAPHMAHMMARALTGGQFTPTQVGSAFKNNTRDTGAGSSEQGHGAYDLHRALTALSVGPTLGAGVASPAHVDTRGGAGIVSSWGITPASSVQTDDMQILISLSAPTRGYSMDPGWVEVNDIEMRGDWEEWAYWFNLRVLARPYSSSQPSTQVLRYSDFTWSALSIMTVRSAGGMDPERFVPIARFGTGTSITAVPVVPYGTNDLQVCVFAQLFDTSATTATLSLPSGLTQRGFWRPGSDATGITMLAATRQLTDGNRTPSYVSTSNTANASDIWATISMTIPGGAAVA
jgi:hypothetical protein